MFLFALAHAAAPITVDVSGAATDAGTVMCQIFRSADGFPSTDAKAVAYSTSLIKGGRAQCVFPAQPPGPIAIAAYHDENANATLDTNFLGLPAEGYGFSNGAQAGMFGPPAFEAAVVTVASAPLTLRLELTK